MNTVIKFNTSYGSPNLGDFIINESADRELASILDDSFVLNFPTHTPVVTFLQTSNKNWIIKTCRLAKYKFLCGTNILSNNMFRPWPNWNINIFNCKPYVGTVLVGCGLNGSFTKANFYTRWIYKKVLSKKYMHSVRDEKTKIFLEGLGLKAINTGCPTIWSLTKEHCAKIPHKKSRAVVFTLTDYCKDPQDKIMLDILRQKYQKIYFWVQGSGDYDYLKSLDEDLSYIHFLYNLEQFRDVLMHQKVDYVGTRLHAGIFAMQHCRRSIIISVDNRTKDMKDSYNLVTVDRAEINASLAKLIDSDFKTDIHINPKAIQRWKSQFITGAKS